MPDVPPLHPALEALGLAFTVAVFTVLHRATGHDIAAAMSNAEHLQSIERALHLDVELAANGWLVRNSWLIGPAVYYYRLYLVVIAVVLVWVYVRHRGVYRHLRRTLVAMPFLGLLVFWTLPMAPPRFALPGIVDIVALYAPFGPDSRDLSSGQNHFSAMPSLHTAWMAWCGYAIWFSLRRTHPRLALLGWLLPVTMVATVLTTGNHYVLDVVAGLALLAVSIGVATIAGALARTRADRR